jgi:hypothetical protein
MEKKSRLILYASSDDNHFFNHAIQNIRALFPDRKDLKIEIYRGGMADWQAHVDWLPAEGYRLAP